MKQRILILLIILSIFSLANAQPEEKEVETEIKNVTVFLNGAQIFREGDTYLKKGMYEIVFDDLSPFIYQQSIQVKGKGLFTILSIDHQINYNKVTRPDKDVKIIQDSINLLQTKYKFQKAEEKVLKSEEEMINANRAIGGEQSGVSLEQLRATSEFYQTRLKKIIMDMTNLQMKMDEVNSDIRRLQTKLNLINAPQNRQVSKVVVLVRVKENTKVYFNLNYISYQAGWMPVYDIRVKDVNEDVKLTHKASITQNTGIDWKDVNLTLSTGNPSLSNNLPSLATWWLNYSRPYSNNSYYKDYSKQKGVVSKGESVKSLSSVQITAQNEPAGGFDDRMAANTSANFTRVSEATINTEYEIDIPYTINSGGKQLTIDVQNYNMPATYEYFAIPKIDKDAFLRARISGWEEYNLIPASANIFFEDTYVGKTYINARYTSDTLNISLGRDKSISVERKKVKEFCETKTIGFNKKESFGYEIIARNKKKAVINIVIQDQVPITKVDDINVDIEETSNGELNKETGIITWKYTIEPSESKKLLLKYSVKFPKNKTVYLR
jgi:uncharacterized protein (TIGR02231 family)